MLTSAGGNGSRVLDSEGVREQYGIPPSRLVDYLAVVRTLPDWSVGRIYPRCMRLIGPS